MAAQRIEGTVALVTGASSGIGAALAYEFARQGADVIAAARQGERLEVVVDRVRNVGRRGIAVSCDVTRDGDLESAVEAGMQAFGRIDWVVANAGFAVTGALRNLGLDDYRRQFETNIFGVLRTAYAARPALLESKGVFAVVGSVAGVVAFPSTSPYSMSKAAIHSLAESLWGEFAEEGVGVTLIIPGYVESDVRKVDSQGVLHPDKTEPVPPWLLMPAERAAHAMVRAIVRRRRELVLTRHGKLAVGLKRHAPWLSTRIVRRFGNKRPGGNR